MEREILLDHIREPVDELEESGWDDYDERTGLDKNLRISGRNIIDKVGLPQLGNQPHLEKDQLQKIPKTRGEVSAHVLQQQQQKV